jgi:putative membrane protein
MAAVPDERRALPERAAPHQVNPWSNTLHDGEKPMQRRTAIGALGAAAFMPGLHNTASAQTRPASGLAQTRQMALLGNQFSTQTSDLAPGRAQHDIVKAFAHFEAAEQRSIVQAMQLARLPVTAVALPPEKMQILQQLQGLQGAAFDSLYLQVQLQGHQELLQAQEGLLAAGSKDEKVIATIAVAAIQQHTAMLQGLQQRLPA